MRLAYSPAALERAVMLLREGRLVAFPTETVYGLGARADDREAVRSIFRAKGRPAGNPLIVHVPSLAAARDLCEEWSDAAERLATALWPGPLTLVVKRRLGESGGVASEVTAGGPTVALRVPAHPVALALLEAAALPVAAPSANRSTSISPTTADHVEKSLGDTVDLVLDGGPTGADVDDLPGLARYGIESTIVDVSRSPAVLLRHGAVPISIIAGLTEVVDSGAVRVAEGERAVAPGSHARHYAPRATVVLVPASEVRGEVERRRTRGEVSGALERAQGASVKGAPALVLPDDPSGYAARLYGALHWLEDEGCDSIVIAEAPAGDSWAAVRDRLKRSSA